MVVEARLQHAIDGAARSTVTSFAGLATELLTIGVFAGYALGASAGASHATLFGALAALYAAVALLLARR